MNEQSRDHNESPSPTAWDNLDEPTPSYEDLRAKERIEACERLQELGAEYRAIESEFIEKYPEAKEKFSGDPEKQVRYNQFFIEKYENRIAHNRFESSANAKLADISNRYYLAQFDNTDLKGNADREKTVEVQSGILYSQRLQDLEAAIAQAGGNKEHAELLKRTWPLVSGHIYYQHMPKKEAMEDPSYDRRRTEAHNQVIEQLNAMNDLARQYGTRPFTCRNFGTTRNYSHKHDQYGRLGNILSTDRAMVQEYFRIAFGSTAQTLIDKLDRENRFR